MSLLEKQTVAWDLHSAFRERARAEYTIIDGLRVIQMMAEPFHMLDLALMDELRRAKKGVGFAWVEDAPRVWRSYKQAVRAKPENEQRRCNHLFCKQEALPMIHYTLQMVQYHFDWAVQELSSIIEYSTGPHKLVKVNIEKEIIPSTLVTWVRLRETQLEDLYYPKSETIEDLKAQIDAQRQLTKSIADKFEAFGKHWHKPFESTDSLLLSPELFFKNTTSDAVWMKDSAYEAGEDNHEIEMEVIRAPLTAPESGPVAERTIMAAIKMAARHRVFHLIKELHEVRKIAFRRNGLQIIMEY